MSIINFVFVCFIANLTELLEGVEEVFVTGGTLTLTDVDNDMYTCVHFWCSAVLLCLLASPVDSFPVKSAFVKILGETETIVYQRLNATVIFPWINVTVCAC